MDFLTDSKRLSLSSIRAIAQAFDEEPHLLPITVDIIKESLDSGLAMALAENGEMIAFTRLVPLVDGVYELGSTWVRKDWRGRHVNHLMYECFLPRHREKNILATTTNPKSFTVGKDLGLVLVRRKDLPEAVWRATCICPAHKILTDDHAQCALAWDEPQYVRGSCCWVRVTPETAARMHLKIAELESA